MLTMLLDYFDYSFTSNQSIIAPLKTLLEFFQIKKSNIKFINHIQRAYNAV